VNTFAAPAQVGPLAPGKSVLVVWNPQAANPLLEREVADRIAALLAERGYTQSTVADADFYLVFGYGIGPGPLHTAVLPVYHPGGVATVYGDVNATVQLPGSWSYVPYTVATNTRVLTIRVADGPRFRDTRQVETVWAADTVSTGKSGDLRNVLNYMLVATFDYFGGNTGRAIQLELSTEDDRVRRLQGGMGPRVSAIPATAQPGAAPVPGTLGGTYTGAISGSQRGQPISMRVTFTIVQQGSEVSGTWTTTGGTSGTLTGRVTGERLTIQAKQMNPCPGDFIGTAAIGENGATLGGSYTGQACGGAVTASFTVVRQ
jgi:hypothetical protein